VFWKNLLFPPICQGCGKIGQWCCWYCLGQIEFFPNPISLASLTNPAIDVAYSAGFFQPPLKKLLLALKYQGVEDIAAWLGEWLYEVLTIPPVDLVTAVPLHPIKYRERGYNQAELIAICLAKKLRRPYKELLIKTQATESQASITDKTSRLSRLNGLFQLKTNYSLLQQRVLLVDDVITTGATLNAAAEPLKTAGAAAVFGLTVAHGK
jgi:ComF family protein